MKRPVEHINGLISELHHLEERRDDETLDPTTLNFINTRIKRYHEILNYIDFLEGKKSA